MKRPLSRRGLWLTLGCAALAAVAWAGYLVYGVSSAGPSGGSVVLSYLRALARGDARAALALAARPPADRSRLTDAVLARQQRLGPISAIEVLGTTYGDYGAVTHVRYRVGATEVDDRVDLARRGSGWGIQNVAVNLEISGPERLPAPEVLGVPVRGDGEVWVFPGVVSFGSATADFALVPSAVLVTEPDVPAMASLRAELSPSGTSAAATAVRAALQPCLTARSLAPAHCPQRLPAAATPGRIRGTERWQPPAGFGALEFAVREREPDQVQASGKLQFRLTYQVQAGKRRLTRAATTTATVSAVIDFGAAPPVATLR